MNQNATQMSTAGVVVLHATRKLPSHERAVQRALAQRIATLNGMEFRDDVDAGTAGIGRIYVIPTGTVVGLDQAQALGITDEDSFFGAVVPHAFVASKAISHSLVDASAVAPEGWSPAFASAVSGATLHGYTAFTPEDALKAGKRMLETGAVRIKPVLATGGRGQTVATDADELAEALRVLDASELASCGVVLEENLEDVTTFSVGRVRIAGTLASYWGTQRLTPDNAGEMVYGGSDLHVVRGDLADLLACELPEYVRIAVEQARLFDENALRHFPGLTASRRNYDIALGTDAQGQRRSGVLEQSWRIGGASGAEVAAVEVFKANPDVAAVTASSIEVFGIGHQPPADARVFYQAEDEEVGFISKYVVVGAYGNAQ